jgi:hypothetical protein
MDLKLISILNEIILEYGDLSNIEPYPYKKLSHNKYSFTDDQGDMVNVEFQSFAGIEVELMPTLRNKKGYNCIFKVNDNIKQYKTTDVREYNRILKTILNINNEFINNNKPDFMFYKGTSKTREDVTDFNIKDRVYFAIIKANTPNEYGYSISNVEGYMGVLLVKEKRKK